MFLVLRAALGEELLLLREGSLGRHDATLAVGVLGRCSAVGVLKGADCVLLIAGNRDDAAAPWHLEDVVAMVDCRHELDEGKVPKDGILREADVGDIEVDELCAVVGTLAKGDREADLP